MSLRKETTLVPHRENKKPLKESPLRAFDKRIMLMIMVSTVTPLDCATPMLSVYLDH